jgi:type IV secretion system protein VirB9
VWHLKRNYLFIQSFAGAKPASLIVRTAAHSYIFDLLPNNAVRLSDQTRTARLVICLDGPPMTNGDGVHEHERLNAAYSIEVVHETEDIRPRDVFDDGRFTFMRFPGNLPIPAIYKSVPGSSEERLVNSHMEGEYVVLEGLSGLWNLRLGSTVLGVFNDAYHSEGRGADSGTTLPGVSRALR